MDSGTGARALPANEAELKALPPDKHARLLHVAELIEQFGPMNLGMPHIRPIEGKLREMRMRGHDGFARALYAAVRGRARHSKLRANAWRPPHENPGHAEKRIAGRCGSAPNTRHRPTNMRSPAN
ncbi:MAG: type II toxin-antitoxin system RelE/ParE family toxin [Rhodocyclaceae bacterium]|nr:type II toxin-antitoxin system RelE/ParE family toxin [Rhodocyclaceae bacterium]